MEGGIAVFLTLLILVGAGIGGFLLFGAGGYARHRQVEGKLGHDDGSDREPEGPRPEHVRVEDDSNATFDIPPARAPRE
ncbi:MAG: hypothetical protein QOD69_933 [Solirubrobacteraceae bacterium]|jgi:hypothetical protein|nr:hypothetical protein [Solirubrobacteraceae bacterium]